MLVVVVAIVVRANEKRVVWKEVLERGGKRRSTTKRTALLEEDWGISIADKVVQIVGDCFEAFTESFDRVWPHLKGKKHTLRKVHYTKHIDSGL